MTYDTSVYTLTIQPTVLLMDHADNFSGFISQLIEGEELLKVQNVLLVYQSVRKLGYNLIHRIAASPTCAVYFH